MSWLSAAFKGGKKNTFTGSQGAIGSLFHRPLQSPILPAIGTIATGGNPWTGAAIGAAQGGLKRGGNIGSAFGGGLQGYGTGVGAQGLLGGFQGMGAGGQGFFPGAMQGAKGALSQNIPGIPGSNPMNWFGNIGRNFQSMYHPGGTPTPVGATLAGGGGSLSPGSLNQSPLLSQWLGGGGGGGGGGFPQTGVNTGDPYAGGNWLGALGGIGNAIGGVGNMLSGAGKGLSGLWNQFGNAAYTGAGLGIIGAADMKKSTDLPSFDTPDVQAMRNFDPNNFQQLPPGMLKSINENMDIKEEQELRSLRNVYKDARPGTDYTTDSAYQRDLKNLQRQQQSDRANAIMNPQLQFQTQQIQANQQRLGQLQELGQLSVSEIMARTGMKFEEAQQLKQQMGQIGSLFLMRGFWPNLFSSK